MRFFNKIESFEDLKKQYRSLLKKHHPDNGGSVQDMQEINNEYEALFSIWKNRHEQATGTTVKETAQDSIFHFYTEYGWAGSRYDGNLSSTEIAKILRIYIKEKYPTWKFSVTTSYFSGGSSIAVCVMEAPVDIFDHEYFEKQVNDGRCRCDRRDFEKMKQEGSYYMQLHTIREREKEPWLNDIGYAVLHDVWEFLQSYNYDDSDGMIDYFSVNFYSSIDIGKWNKGFRIVPKTARIKPKNGSPVKKKTTDTEKTDEAPEIAKKYSYTVEKGNDTRDGSELWVVRIVEKLNREEYLKENKEMQKRGAYYSRYLHGFIFREDPSDILDGSVA